MKKLNASAPNPTNGQLEDPSDLFYTVLVVRHEKSHQRQLEGASDPFYTVLVVRHQKSHQRQLVGISDVDFSR